MKLLHKYQIEHYSPGTDADSIDSIQITNSPACTDILLLIRYFNGHFMA